MMKLIVHIEVDDGNLEEPIEDTLDVVLEEIRESGVSLGWRFFGDLEAAMYWEENSYDETNDGS